MNPTVSGKLLQEINSWRREGASDRDVITRLRQRTVPNGYSYHTWIPGLLRAAQIFPELCNGILSLTFCREE